MKPDFHIEKKNLAYKMWWDLEMINGNGFAAFLRRYI